MFLQVMLVHAVVFAVALRGRGLGIPRRGAEEERTVIEPVPEAVEAILHQVFCGPEVEPGIDYTISSAN